MSLQLREVIEKGWLHALRLRGNRLDGRCSGTSPDDDSVGFLAIGRQSCDVCLSVFFLTRTRPGTEPGPFIAALVRVFSPLKPRDDFNIVFRYKAPEGYFAIHKHGQCRGLHSSNRKLLTIKQRIRTREIHANEPIGSTSPIRRIGQSIVLTARTKPVETLSD